jgi:cytochrome c biogenesis protein CcdA
MITTSSMAAGRSARPGGRPAVTFRTAGGVQISDTTAGVVRFAIRAGGLTFMLTRSRWLLASLVLLAPLSGVADAQLKRPRADITNFVGSDAVPAGGDVRVALRATLPETLHVQSNAPRDPTLIATVLTIDAPAGVDVKEIVYPKAIEFRQVGQPEPLDVFGHEFVIGVRLAVAASVPAGDLLVPARLRYQACDAQMCFAPVTADVPWTLRVVPAGARVAATHADVFAQVAFGKGTAPAATVTAPAAPARTPVAPPPAPATPAAGTSSGAAPIEAGGPGGDGLSTLDRFEIVASTGGYLASEDFIQFLRDAEGGVRRQGMLEGKGLIAMLLIVLVGGLALNLTPCVLPMIPINLAIIGAGANAGSRGRGFALGSAYGAAMALVYGVLGVVVILTAGSFGTINASPWFNLVIAIVFVALALAMFDVFQIDFSRFSGNVGADGAARGSLALAFTMGAVAALLAGACVAPVVIQVVLFSSDLYAKGHTLALALPFVLGLGMAAPWPLAGAGIAALPRPGAWMTRVKQAFGILILATAAYYGYLAYTLFANRWVEASAVTSSVEEKLKAGWHSSLASGLAAAQREGKPAMIDLWATWCKNCLTMDQTTFDDPAVKAALDGYVKIKVQAEDPEEPSTRAVMQRFKAVGLPTYVIVRPKAAGGVS